MTIGAVLLIALPIIALLWRSVREQAWHLVPESGVSQAVWLSLQTSVLSLILILILGTPLAYLLDRHRFQGRRLLNILVEMPIVLPPAVAGLGLLVAFGRRGLLGPPLESIGISLVFTREAVIIAQTFVALPFYTRAAQTGFHYVNREIEEAALVDGATHWGVFRLITVPIASKALLSGALLSWARALGEFGATIIFAGSLAGETRTMPLLVYNILERDINAAIWTALLLVGMASFTIALIRIIDRDEPD